MTESLVEKRLVKISLLVVLAISVLACGLISVYGTRYANGWDGYYYLVQIQSFTNTGVMHSPEYSPVYIPMLAAHSITGDYLMSSKISAVFIKMLFVMSVFSLSLTILRSAHPGKRNSCFFTALMTAAISSASPSLNYFFVQFPKNLMGFSFFFFFIASLLSTATCLQQRVRGNRKGIYSRVSASVLLFLAAFFTHRFTAVLSLIFLALYLAFFAKIIFHRLSWRSSKLIRVIMIASISLIIVFLISGRLPLAPRLHDIARITGDLSKTAILMPSAFREVFGIHRLNPEWILEIYLAAVLPIMTLLLLVWRKKFRFIRLGKGYYVLIIMSFIGLFPFLEFSLTGLAYRLFFGTLLMLPLLFAPYLWLLTEKILKPSSSTGNSVRRVLYLFVFTSILAVSFFTDRSYRPEIHDPPYPFYEEVAENAVNALGEVEFDLIIAHKALAEFITFTYEVDALPWAPEERFKRDRVWRITAGILRDEVSYYLSPEIADSYFFRLRGDYGLLREDHWETFVERVSGDPVMMDAIEVWRNPMEVRPKFLTSSN